MRKFQLDPFNGLGGDVTFRRPDRQMDGLTENGKTISPHFFGKQGDNHDIYCGSGEHEIASRKTQAGDAGNCFAAVLVWIRSDHTQRETGSHRHAPSLLQSLHK
jgi:hypothetical protein